MAAATGLKTFDDAEMKLRQDLDATPPKACFYNDAGRDWRIYVANKHPLLACCLGYDVHVVSPTLGFTAF